MKLLCCVEINYFLMTLEQLSLLSDDELNMCLFIVNHIAPKQISYEIGPRDLCWFRKGILEKKLAESFDKVKPDYHSIYSSLLNKLSIQHKINIINNGN